MKNNGKLLETIIVIALGAWVSVLLFQVCLTNYKVMNSMINVVEKQQVNNQMIYEEILKEGDYIGE